MCFKAVLFPQKGAHESAGDLVKIQMWVQEVWDDPKTAFLTRDRGGADAASLQIVIWVAECYLDQ